MFIVLVGAAGAANAATGKRPTINAAPASKRSAFRMRPPDVRLAGTRAPLRASTPCPGSLAPLSDGDRADAHPSARPPSSGQEADAERAHPAEPVCMPRRGSRPQGEATLILVRAIVVGG